MDTCYPISMRYVHGQRTRTNNHLEGWHSKVNKDVGRHHPSIYTLLRYLKAEQAATELTLRRARLGAAPKPPRRKYRTMDATVQRLTAAYDSGEVPALQFLEEFSEVVQQMRRRRQH